MWKLAALNLGWMFDEANSILADTPWGDLGGFRLNAARRAPFAIETNGETRVIDCWAGEDVGGGGRSIGNAFIATEHGVTFGFRLARPSGGAAGPAADGAILSPMPGRIIAVEVAAGEAVAKGQKLVTLEAMKMEHTLTAPFDGTIADIAATEGAQVREGSLLVRVERKEG